MTKPPEMNDIDDGYDDNKRNWEFLRRNEPQIGDRGVGVEFAYKKPGDGWVTGNDLGEGTPRAIREAGHEHISEWVAALNDEWDQLSAWGKALLTADELATNTMITRHQAEIWVSRELAGWDRGTVAAVYDVTKSNVDELHSRASNKIEQAGEIQRILDSGPHT